jgi:uncharacterized phiE125 gp8 family phage protein
MHHHHHHHLREPNWSLHLITAPTDKVVTLAEAKLQLRLTDTKFDDFVEATIAAVVAQIDPAGGGWLGRALCPQVWELRLDCFHSAIELPYPPLMEIVSVTYDDADGVAQTLAVDTGYRLFGGGKAKSYLVPPYNGSWPSSVRCAPESVRIQYKAGYAKANMPPQIKQSVLLGLRDLWSLGENNLYMSSEELPGVISQSFVVSDNASRVLRAAMENLLGTLRVYE